MFRARVKVRVRIRIRVRVCIIMNSTSISTKKAKVQKAFPLRLVGATQLPCEGLRYPTHRHSDGAGCLVHLCPYAILYTPGIRKNQCKVETLRLEP